MHFRTAASLLHAFSFLLPDDHSDRRSCSRLRGGLRDAGPVPSISFLRREDDDKEGQSSGTRLFALLEAQLLHSAADLSASDIARSLAALSRLALPSSTLLESVRPRVLELVRCGTGGGAERGRGGVGNSGKGEESAIFSGVLVELAIAYASCNVDGEATRNAIVDRLAVDCANGRPVPAVYIAQLLRGIGRAPPGTLARCLEVSLPDVVGRLRIQDLVVIVTQLAFVPEIRASQGGLGRAVFGACLAAPLSAFRPNQLVGMLRSAWALGHTDTEFWVPALREAELSALGEASRARPRWFADDLVIAALTASRVTSFGTT